MGQGMLVPWRRPFIQIVVHVCVLTGGLSVRNFMGVITMASSNEIG